MRSATIVKLLFLLNFCCGDLQGQALENRDSFNCNLYLNLKWLPDAYIQNALCACNRPAPDSQFHVVRTVLFHLALNTDSGFKAHCAEQKLLLKGKQIPKRKYKRFVRSQIAPIIRQQHTEAYIKAGCISGPSGLWAWKLACTHRFKNCDKMFKRHMRWGGSCHGKRNSW